MINTERANNQTVVELFREDMKFSAAHFTIFSAKEREMLHGHNFHVYVSVTSEIDNNELAFDYTVCRKKILAICKSLNERCLMPANSKYLKVEEQIDSYEFSFNSEKLIFPKKDILLLPLANITTEALARWFLESICVDKELFDFINATSMTVKISTGPGQYSSISKNFRAM